MECRDFTVKYGPLLRLLQRAREDRNFLQAQEGFTPQLGREYEQIRRTAILGYLRSLQEDWHDIAEQALPYALRDERWAANLADVQARLHRTLRKIRLRLFLEQWSGSRRWTLAAREAQKLLIAMSTIHEALTSVAS